MKKIYILFFLLVIVFAALISCTGSRFANGNTSCPAIGKQRLIGY